MRLAFAVAVAAVLASGPASAAEEGVLLEFHFEPVPNAQIAIWVTAQDGTFVEDVFVTQSTATLGIGNRPGRWDFLSSWRFPYGVRPQVLPVWAHARGKTYPKIIFHDDTDVDSLGWHENTSSFEPYYCRPLKPEEEAALLIADVMTCPSPAVFQTDKGMIVDGTSRYPPRADLTMFEDEADLPDILMYPELNDLDAVSGATPAGEAGTMVTAIVPRDAAEAGPLLAWIEINIEDDENASYSFDREDHWIDPALPDYGIEYFGQPSVVYRLEVDAMQRGFVGTDMYAGYGEFDGLAGTLNPPDTTISTTNGSGADRLQLYTKNDETFRFGVYSHGPNSGDDDPDDGWGGCKPMDLPAVTDFVLEPMEFDVVRVHFTVPALDPATEVGAVTIYYRAGDMPITDDNVSGTIQQVPTEDQCDVPPAPGTTTWCELEQLFGNFDYEVGLRYEDLCHNKSPLVSAPTSTPAQKFATVQGACFVATAAWGAAWEDRVRALRSFRDRVLTSNAVGAALVQFYYANSPMLSRAIAERPWARAMARQLLTPAADLATLTMR